MKGSYQLSKSNKVFFLIISTLYIIRYFLFININAESFGYLLGTLFSFFLFAIILSLLIWFITRKNNHYGSIAFNVMLAFMLLAQFSQFVNSLSGIK